jgi:glycerophosphoryl diester phosphodiesterase
MSTVMALTGNVTLVALTVIVHLSIAAQGRKETIAHRGSSGYAPEHTLAAYRLAMDQHADFVEPDLAVTRDGVLICLHDDTLERTTNVADIFPARVSSNLRGLGRGPSKRWIANDFNLDEIRQLDAGAWFDQKFAGQRVVTFQEMIDLVRGHAGLYPELKSPELYATRGVDMEQIFVETIKRNGLETPESLKTTPLIIQSFDEPTVRRVASDLPTIPRVLLTFKDEDVSECRLRSLTTFATGIAPEKGVIARHPNMVKTAHALGLTVTAWTFRADERTQYANVREEMNYFLFTLGIDALFTNNPDLVPRQQPSAGSLRHNQ